MGILRILLAISIIFVHAGKPFGYEMIPSKIAIQSFYIISGFYMALILNGKYNLKKNAYKIFITNRFLRIYPLYWIVLVLTIGMDLYLCHGSISQCLYLPVGSNILSTIQYLLKNVFIFPSVGYLTPSAYFLGGFIVPITWTLGVELLFYLIAPFIVKRGIKAIIAIAIVSFIIRIFVFRFNAMEAQGFLNLNMWFLPSEFGFFMFGVIAYKLYSRIQNVDIPKFVYSALTIGILLFTLFLSTILNLLPGREGLVGWIYYVSIMGVIPFLFNFSKKNKISNLLGELTYAIYISHSLIILLLPINLLKIDKNIYPFVIFFATFIFALILRRLIEMPINTYRQKKVIRVE